MNPKTLKFQRDYHHAEWIRADLKLRQLLSRPSHSQVLADKIEAGLAARAAYRATHPRTNWERKGLATGARERAEADRAASRRTPGANGNGPSKPAKG